MGHTIHDDAGKIGDEHYDSTMHYCTVTFTVPESGPISDKPSNRFADLPFEITSFGAARLGDTAFVYGGHSGESHSYSTEEQSNQLLTLNLENDQAEWKVATTGDRLQGLAMVPHHEGVIVIGGFTARNGLGEEHDLHSVARVRMYRPDEGVWSELPALPSGRSSHDAAILGDKIYVVGGWEMDGNENAEWHSSALVLNLKEENPRWREIASPPFERRASAVAAHNDQIFVVGGMDRNGGPTKEVAVYDPKTDSWGKGPALLGEGSMAGFGAAAWSTGGRLIVSTYEGDILRLDETMQVWKKLGKSKASRFFHRLIPLGETELLIVGGANMYSGKFLELETISTE